MGLFSRKDATDEPPPVAAAPAHPALATFDALASAPLEELATAVLVVAFEDRHPRDRYNAFELLQRIEGMTGGGIPEINLLVEEALGVLQRSLLVVVDYGGSNARPHLALTRRGRRALESGAPERWIDLPADPA
jgi:hypothetical protein